jgi:hypothetical protein
MQRVDSVLSDVSRDLYAAAVLHIKQQRRGNVVRS